MMASDSIKQIQTKLFEERLFYCIEPGKVRIN